MEKIPKNQNQKFKSRAAAERTVQFKKGSDRTLTFVDNRPETVVQQKVIDMMRNSPLAKQTAQLKVRIQNSPHQVAQRQAAEMMRNSAHRIAQRDGVEEKEPLQGKFETVQSKENKTGMPDNLKSGLENLSGMSMDHVRVHYHSDKPAQLNAHAYTQGSDIHVVSGQEKHLPHEGWHVVQQAQGRVKPTMQMAGTQINDDTGLEQEADIMGWKALSMPSVSPPQLIHEKINNVEPVQRKWDFLDDNVMQWDEDLGGLSWFYNTDNGFLSFKITDDSPGYMVILKAYEGKPRPYNEWVEIWTENDWPTQGFDAIKPKVQAFGTDIPEKGNPLISEPEERSEEEKIDILAQAMQAGYTLFDTAELYCSAHLIEKAAKKAGVDVKSLTIVYKAKPVNDEENSGSLEENVPDFSKRIKSQMLNLPAKSQKVLMLHELPKDPKHISTYIDALYDIAISGDAGMVESLGVSNVDITQLKNICRYTSEKK